LLHFDLQVLDILLQLFDYFPGLVQKLFIFFAQSFQKAILIFYPVNLLVYLWIPLLFDQISFIIPKLHRTFSGLSPFRREKNTASSAPWREKPFFFHGLRISV